MAHVSAQFHLFVAALDIDLWVEWVNTDAITDANIADMPSRFLSGCGKHSKITLPIAERPGMISICEIEFQDPALFLKKRRE